MDKHNVKNIRRLGLVTVALVLLAAWALSVIEGLPYGEAVYSAIIILLTHIDHHGFSDPAGRIIVVILILSNFAIVAYLIKTFADYMMGLTTNVKRLRVKKKVDKMSGHYIVCGLGRVGSQVAGEMNHEAVTFIGLDRDQARVDEMLALGYNALTLDSTDESSLKAAGIDRAAGLVACLSEDSLNLFVVLAARSLNPNLYIVARANRPENQVKLKRAGANRVAMPYQIGGYHMASMALRPNVVDYIDIMSKNGSSELEVEEMVVGEDSRLAGKPLGRTLAEDEVGATIIAINGVDGSSRVRPTGREIIYPGDRLIILGSKPDLTAASELIR